MMYREMFSLHRHSKLRAVCDIINGMKVGIQSWGSAGDIRPLIALGSGLRLAGHEVTMAATSVDNRDYSSLCDTLGFRYVKVPEHIEADLADLPEKAGGVAQETRIMKVLFNELFHPYVEDMYRAAKMLCADNDLVIGHFTVYPLQIAARKAGRPFVSVTYWPGLVPTASYSPFRGKNLGRVLNRFQWKLFQLVLNTLMKKDIDRLWQREGMPTLRNVIPEAWFSKTLNLIPVSTALWSPPPDWGEPHRICGYFTVPDSAEPWEMPPRLRDFFDSGPPPVYMTLGSTQQVVPEESMLLLTEAAGLAGCRAVIQTSSERFPPDTEEGDLYFVGRIPHHRIFHRCAAVVHHGGAGTSHSATRLGCPSVVVWFIDEQFSWGRQLQSHKVACEPLRSYEATPQKLARRIRLVLDTPSMKKKAEELAASMQAEDGVGEALRLIEDVHGRI